MINRSVAAVLVLILPFAAAQACGDDAAESASPSADAAPLGDATLEASTHTDATIDVVTSDAASDVPVAFDGPSVDDGSDGALGDAADAATDADALIADAAAPDGDAGCVTAVNAYAVVASPHVASCSPVTYGSNPPTSGPHYPVWAAYRTYSTPVHRGFYVHDLEHGAVVIQYNCPSGCAQELADLQAFLDARAADPLCVGNVKHRYVVTPDPAIPTKFAASAWGYALTSTCLDLAALGTFIDDHYAHGAEVTCADGTDVTAADAGFGPDCGN